MANADELYIFIQKFLYAYVLFFSSKNIEILTKFASIIVHKHLIFCYPGICMTNRDRERVIDYDNTFHHPSSKYLNAHTRKTDSCKAVRYCCNTFKGH